MKISDNALISTKHKDLVFKTVEKFIPDSETVLIALKGTYKEYLLCTDKQLYIIKEGVMTGHTFGQGVFKMPYRNISSVSMDFHFATGYFEVSSGGVQNTKKSYWANSHNATSAQRSPNTISLVKPLASDFAKASDMINDIIEKVHNGTNSTNSLALQTTNSTSTIDQLRELKQLLDEEIITQDEFDAKKKDILNI